MIIRTVFRGPTDHFGARIIATAPDFSKAWRVVRPYCYASDAEQNHAAAAMELAGRLGVAGEWTNGEDRGCLVWVRVFPSTRRFQSEAKSNLDGGMDRRSREALLMRPALAKGGAR